MGCLYPPVVWLTLATIRLLIPISFSGTGKAWFGLAVGCTGKARFRLAVGCTGKAWFGLAGLH